MDLLSSPFDDIRTLASLLLKGYDPDGLSAEKESSLLLTTLLSLENRSETKAEISGRSDYADGQARVYELKMIYEARIPRKQKYLPSTAPLEHVLRRIEEKMSGGKARLVKSRGLNACSWRTDRSTVCSSPIA